MVLAAWESPALVSAIMVESIPTSLRFFGDLLSRTARAWSRRNAVTQAAAIAFFSLVSIAPVLILVIAIAGAAYGRQNVRDHLVGQFEALMGERAASAIETTLALSTRDDAGPVARVFGLVAFGLGATAVFTQLQRSLNRMWNVEPRAGRPLARVVLKRLVSLALVIAIGFLLLVSLVVSAAVSGLQELLQSRFRILAAALDSTNAILSIAVFTLLFAVMYRFLPDVEIDWKDVWVGALVTAVLLTASKSAIGIYVGRSALASTYGAAASVVVLLLWIYMSSLLVLFGAVFTRVWCLRVRHHYPRPEEGARHARRLPVEDGT